MPRRRNRVYSLETLERRDCPAGFTLTPLNQVVSEGNSAEFQLTLDAVSQVPESVIVTSKSGTAIIGSDFMQMDHICTNLHSLEMTAKSVIMVSSVTVQLRPVSAFSGEAEPSVMELRGRKMIN